MKRTFFWLRLALIVFAWLFVLVVLATLAINPSAQLAAEPWGKFLVGLLGVGHVGLGHRALWALLNEYQDLARAAEPFIVTGTGHRA